MDQVKHLEEECTAAVAKILFAKSNHETYTYYKQTYTDKKYLIQAIKELYNEETNTLFWISCAKEASVRLAGNPATLR